MILRDVPGYALYFIPYTLFCEWMNPNGNGSPHPCSIWLAGGLAGKYHHGMTLLSFEHEEHMNHGTPYDENENNYINRFREVNH